MCIADGCVLGPPALLPASHVRRHSGVNEHALKTDNPSVIQAQALPLLTQQQQLEVTQLIIVFLCGLISSRMLQHSVPLFNTLSVIV